MLFCSLAIFFFHLHYYQFFTNVHSPLLAVIFRLTRLSLCFFFNLFLLFFIKCIFTHFFQIYRTFVIWMVSLAVLWQKFHWQHLIGFLVLILGMCEYNGILPRPWRRREESQVIDSEADRLEEA